MNLTNFRTVEGNPRKTQAGQGELCRCLPQRILRMYAHFRVFRTKFFRIFEIGTGLGHFRVGLSAKIFRIWIEHAAQWLLMRRCA